jgi:hypothetical protein
MLWGDKTKWIISFDSIVELLHQMNNQPTPPTTPTSLKLKCLQLIPHFQYPVDIEVDKSVIDEFTSINDQLMCIDDCLITGIHNSDYLLTMSIADIHTCMMTINESRNVDEIPPNPFVYERPISLCSGSMVAPACAPLSIVSMQKKKQQKKRPDEALVVEPLDCFQSRFQFIGGNTGYLKISHPLPTLSTSLTPSSSISSLASSVSESMRDQHFRIYRPSYEKCEYYDSQTKQWHEVSHSLSKTFKPFYL